ncbi:LysR family transcriptional regulator [Catenulispora yoronensis]|uniref:LysR family transcriptional regulator n=1 Tax=Catenulispora yoronensis TaxID=450799 RepID=A0ABN2U9W7_9ACTN
MDTALLEVFLEVARRESFTAAAAPLGFTQSAVSRQIATLEAAVGAPLFDRLPRGVRLTEEGRALLPHAEAVVGRLRAAVGDVRAVRILGGGRLRLGAIPTAEMALVPRAIAAFRRAHPGVAVTHAEGLTRGLTAALRAGDLDLAVIGTPDPEPVFEGVRLRRLMGDPLAVALPVGHRLAGRDVVRLADLAGENWIAGQARPEETLIAGVRIAQDKSLRGRAAEAGAATRDAQEPDAAFRPVIDYVVLEWAAKQGFVAAGLGVTLIPSLAAAAVRSDVVVVALDPEEVAPRSVFAATPEGVADSAAVTAFLKLLTPIR